MAISRDELKKKRLQAMGVVSTERQATADMYDRVVAVGQIVAAKREAAETAHMADLQDQISDLTEMAEEIEEFAQTVPTSGGTGGTKPSASTASPAANTAKPSSASAALAALNATQPNPKAWEKQTVGSDDVGDAAALLTDAPKPDAAPEPAPNGATIAPPAPEQLTVNGVSKQS
jgi:hypothetical protein